MWPTSGQTSSLSDGATRLKRSSAIITIPLEKELNGIGRATFLRSICAGVIRIVRRFAVTVTKVSQLRRSLRPWHAQGGATSGRSVD